MGRSRRALGPNGICYVHLHSPRGSPPPPFRKARKRQCEMAGQRGPRKVPVEKSHHGTLWDVAKHSVFAAQISFCGKESPWNPLGHHPFSESTQTPVSDGPATGAQKGSCGKEPLLGHCNTQRFRDPDKFLCKRVTMEPFGTSPLFGKHANASVWWPGNGGPEKFLWERATMEPFGASQNIAFSRPR